MAKKTFVQLLTVLTFLLSLTQTNCGEHICMPTIIGVFSFLFIKTSFELWGLVYLLGTFGQIYVIIKPNNKYTKYIYTVCFILLLFPLYKDLSYWLEIHKWINVDLFWWFTAPFLILSLTNIYILFKRQNQTITIEQAKA